MFVEVYQAEGEMAWAQCSRQQCPPSVSPQTHTCPHGHYVMPGTPLTGVLGETEYTDRDLTLQELTTHPRNHETIQWGRCDMTQTKLSLFYAFYKTEDISKINKNSIKVILNSSYC